MLLLLKSRIKHVNLNKFDARSILVESDTLPSLARSRWHLLLIIKRKVYPEDHMLIEKTLFNPLPG